MKNLLPGKHFTNCGNEYPRRSDHKSLGWSRGNCRVLCPQLNILPLEGIQDFLRFTSMKSISQEPINKNSVIPRGLDHDPYICTNSC